MSHDAIFNALPREVLPEIARYVGFNPLISEKPFKTLGDLPHLEQAGWLDSRRNELEDELCAVGSWTFGSTKSYREIVVDLAIKIGATYAAGSDIPAVELAILTKVWNDAVKKMTPEQLEQLKAQAEAFAKEHGRGFSKEFAGFATLTAAQMSGFGIYLLGSTLLGAINSALGLGLSFGAFTGLSSLISTVIGPFGWAALGLATIIKLGAPNYKKILPAVILIAASRPLIKADLASAAEPLRRPDVSASAVVETATRPDGSHKTSAVSTVAPITISAGGPEAQDWTGT